MTANRLFYGIPSKVTPEVIRPHECPVYLTQAVVSDLRARYGHEPLQIIDQDAMQLDMGGMKMMNAECIAVSLPYLVHVDLDQIPVVVAYLQYGRTKKPILLGGSQVVKLHRFHHTVAVFPAADLEPLLAALLPHVERATHMLRKNAESLNEGGLLHIVPPILTKRVEE